MSVELTAETVQKAREWFAANARACIADAQLGAFRVNDLPRYVAEREQYAVDALAGAYDHTFTFRQLAYWLQTGECVALLR